MYLKINLLRGFLVSEQDLYLLDVYPFHDNSGYPRTMIGNKNIYLHRLIMPEANKTVDHINRVGYDNRRENLRYVTQQQNLQNRSVQPNLSGYKGVHKNGHNWSACIKINGKKIHLGTFLSKEEAALEYNKAALKLFGEYAALNIVES